MECNSLHPASFDLECFNVQALPPEQHDRIGVHLESCDSCRAYLDELHDQQTELLNRLPVVDFVAAVKTRVAKPAVEPGRTWWKPALSAAMAAGLALVLTWILWPSGRESVRTMGSFQVECFVKSRERVVRIDRTADVRPGDSVRFVLLLPQPGFVTVFFLAEDGHLSWYLPARPEAPPLKVSAGQVALPGSARFDVSRTSERAFVVFSPDVFVPAEVAERVKLAWKQSEGKDFEGPEWLPAGDNMKSLVFRKR